MPITLDTSNAGTTGSGVSSLSWTHTVNSGSNQLLVVSVGTQNNPLRTVTSVTWNTTSNLSNSVNSINAISTDSSSTQESSLWYLKAPTAGSFTIAVTFSASANSAAASSTSWNNVNQSGTFNSNSPSIYIAGSAQSVGSQIMARSSWNEMIIDSVATGGNAATVGPGQTQIQNVNPAAGSRIFSSYAVGDDRRVMSWQSGVTVVSADIVAISIISIYPVITVQPNNSTRFVSQSASFSVSATGTGVLHYQWKNNGINVGSDASSYTLSSLAIGDNGATITVDVTDDNGTTTSKTVVLTVYPSAPYGRIKA